jgi:L-rhamnose isomerase
MVLEYKLFEPSFYTTDVPDWGTAYAHCLALGPKAKVVVDTGHHAPGTNIEFIVASLIRADKLGAFDFNSRFYADDDLMVGSADPFQLFRIMHEVVRGGAFDAEAGVAFMLDQCHNIEPKIPGQIRSVMNVQEATAGLLVDGRPRTLNEPATCSVQRRADAYTTLTTDHPRGAESLGRDEAHGIFTRSGCAGSFANGSGRASRLERMTATA